MLPIRGLEWPSRGQRSSLMSLHSTLFLPSPLTHTQFTPSPIWLNVGRLLKAIHSPLSPVGSRVHRKTRILQVPKSFIRTRILPSRDTAGQQHRCNSVILYSLKSTLFFLSPGRRGVWKVCHHQGSLDSYQLPISCLQGSTC